MYLSLKLAKETLCHTCLRLTCVGDVVCCVCVAAVLSEYCVVVDWEMAPLVMLVVAGQVAPPSCPHLQRHLVSWRRHIGPLTSRCLHQDYLCHQGMGLKIERWRHELLVIITSMDINRIYDIIDWQYTLLTLAEAQVWIIKCYPNTITDSWHCRMTVCPYTNKLVRTCYRSPQINV